MFQFLKKFKPKPDRFHWPRYYTFARNFEPRETMRMAVDLFEKETTPSNPICVDLGCGNGVDTLHLLEHGWQVLAIDSSEQGLSELKKKVPTHLRHNLEIQQNTMQAASFPTCDFINASFALPFCPEDDFGLLWNRIGRRLKKGGRFAGQFFGPNDTWATVDDRTLHFDKDAVMRLLHGFEIEHFEEKETDSFDATGEPKHWHVFHVVARKKK